MTRVIYTGAFRFPNLDAAARRVAGVAGLFERAGCSVAFAGWEPVGPAGIHYRHDEHDCYSMAEFREQSINPAVRLIKFFLRGSRTLCWLDSRTDVDAIVAYNPPALFAYRLLRLGRRRGIRIVLDSTEWYEADHLPGGRFGPAALENWLRMRWAYPRFRHVICISHLLERHYSSRRNRNVVVVRPLLGGVFGTASADRRPPISNELALVYAGDAGKKDLLVPLIRALPSIQQALGVAVKLRIAGIDRQGLETALTGGGVEMTAVAPLVECLGRIPQEAVAELYAGSHFSILLREDKRYAWAGFPTKAVESWSTGCPIIANPVGDMGGLATHMVDAILIRLESLDDDLVASLKAVIQKDLFPAMSRASVSAASRHFASDAALPRFKDFFAALLSSAA